LGSFILNTEHKETDGYVDIIDGQQRLLTITILMSVIRDIAKELDEKRLTQSKDMILQLNFGMGNLLPN